MGLTVRPVAATSRRTGWLLGLAIVGLLAAGLWLRWLYVTNVAVHIDEFTTLWAARRILETGVPVMPSGVVYARGLFPTYVIAAVGTLADLTYLTGRLPSVIFGVATVAAAFLAGRREWNARVGWLAALGLTLLPEAIDASRAALLCGAAALLAPDRLGILRRHQAPGAWGNGQHETGLRLSPAQAAPPGAPGCSVRGSSPSRCSHRKKPCSSCRRLRWASCSGAAGAICCSRR